MVFGLFHWNLDSDTFSGFAELVADRDQWSSPVYFRLPQHRPAP